MKTFETAYLKENSQAPNLLPVRNQFDYASGNLFKALAAIESHGSESLKQPAREAYDLHRYAKRIVHDATDAFKSYTPPSSLEPNGAQLEPTSTEIPDSGTMSGEGNDLKFQTLGRAEIDEKIRFFLEQVGREVASR